ncbi:MAG: hypothetical protein WD055_05545 [Candidatus Dependentiae bacterium]
MQKQIIILLTCLHIGIMQSAAQGISPVTTQSRHIRFVDDFHFHALPNGCYANTLKEGPYFNENIPAIKHLHTALNILYSHAQSNKVTLSQKESYLGVCSMIRQISSKVPSTAPELLKQLHAYQPVITHFKAHTPLNKSRAFAITETWRGLFRTCTTCDINLPEFTRQMREALNSLKQDFDKKKSLGEKRKRE